MRRLREEIRAIVNTEVARYFPISMQRSRISFARSTYLISVVVFEDNSRLGYFDYQLLEIGLSKKLMYTSQDEVLKNIIRHELAHFICYLIHGPNEAHTFKFKEICRKLNWNDEVERAYSNIEAENEKVLEKNTKTEQLLLKLKKLMALATSDNAHEAELATIKANQLLLQHNLSYIHNENVAEDTFVIKRVLSSSRKSTKHSAISNILQTFCVSTIFNHGEGICYLEVVGDETSALLAEYVANYLDVELDLLWIIAQKENQKLKGLAAKNSFFRGVAKGYVMKINQEKTKSANRYDLSLIENNLVKQKNIAYPNLCSSSGSSIVNDQAAQALGVLTGKNLSIKPGLSSSSNQIFLLN
jgi:hypothetical protein